MNKILKEFLDNKVSLEQVKNYFGESLCSVKIETPQVVHARDIVFIIEQYLNKKIEKQELLDWVNTIWFTDLYEYNSTEEESIASVMSLLETLDEEDAEISIEQLHQMINALSNNKAYVCE